MGGTIFLNQRIKKAFQRKLRLKSELEVGFLNEAEERAGAKVLRWRCLTHSRCKEGSCEQWLLIIHGLKNYL